MLYLSLNNAYIIIICTTCSGFWLPHCQQGCQKIFYRGQSFTIWLIVCFAAPQLQDRSGALCQWFAAHTWYSCSPWLVPRWFKFALRCLGELKAGGRAVRSSNTDLHPAIHHNIHQELSTFAEKHPTILDAVMADEGVILDVWMKWQTVLHADIGQPVLLLLLCGKVEMQCDWIPITMAVGWVGVFPKQNAWLHWAAHRPAYITGEY